MMGNYYQYSQIKSRQYTHRMYCLLFSLSLRWEGVIAIGVLLTDFSISAMNDKFAMLITCQLSTDFNGFALGLCSTVGF